MWDICFIRMAKRKAREYRTHIPTQNTYKAIDRL